VAPVHRCDPSAHRIASIGFVRFNWEYDWRGAAQSLRRAIELNPNNETAHRWRIAGAPAFSPE